MCDLYLHIYLQYWAMFMSKCMDIMWVCLTTQTTLNSIHLPKQKNQLKLQPLKLFEIFRQENTLKIQHGFKFEVFYMQL